MYRFLRCVPRLLQKMILLVLSIPGKAVVVQVSRQIYCLTQVPSFPFFITTLSMAPCVACTCPLTISFQDTVQLMLFSLHSSRIDLIASIFECNASFFLPFYLFSEAYPLRGFSLLLICVCLCIYLGLHVKRRIDLS